MKKILITGSEGFIGKKLINLLNKEKKYKIYGIDRTFKSQKYNFFKCSLDQFVKKKTNLKFDYIIHLAANSNPYEKNQKELINDNLLSSVDLFHKLSNKKTKFLFASSEWVYQQQTNSKKIVSYNENSKIDISLLNPYSLTKYLFELYALKHKRLYKNVIVMRFGIILGNKLNNQSAIEMILNKLLKNKVIKIGSLMNARNYISLTDLTLNIIKLFSINNSDIYNITGSKNLNFKKIIKDFEKKFNKKSKIIEMNRNNSSIRVVENKKIKKVIKFSETSYYQDLI